MVSDYHSKVIELIQNDTFRTTVLKLVYELNIPQSYVAAGFVRNLVWDHLHNKETSTPLNDVDVIYFDAADLSIESEQLYEHRLRDKLPLNWQVRNQARMHLVNKDRPYIDILDAMAFWPEKETAVAVRKTCDGYECISAFGYESLFALHISHNPLRSTELFEKRVILKGWLQNWPLLTVYKN
ncbi:nucleotidyltransferase family protein [Vibrio sp.]|nr:nucleotidyltransferase family protein [Vibrio sp.]